MNETITLVTNNFIGLIILAWLVGGGMATFFWWWEYKTNHRDCHHEYEEIINDTLVADSNNVKSHVVVYMCKKCGKKVKTKV